MHLEINNFSAAEWRNDSLPSQRDSHLVGSLDPYTYPHFNPFASGHLYGYPIPHFDEYNGADLHFYPHALGHRDLDPHHL